MQFVDRYNETHTVESLQKRMDRIPSWYWERRPAIKVAIQGYIDDLAKVYSFDTVNPMNFKQPMIKADDSLGFIEYKLEDWATD